MNPFRGCNARQRPKVHEPSSRPWTTSSSVYGAFAPGGSSRAPFAASTPRFNAVVFEPPPSPIKHGGAGHWEGGLTSEGIGSFYSSFKPLARPRPASECTIMMRNQAISSGKISSEAIGQFTGVTPRRTIVGGFQSDHDVRTPGERLGVREFDVIGIHPMPKLDETNRAEMQSEAAFARRFPWHPQGGASPTAKRLQTTWLSKAERS